MGDQRTDWRPTHRVPAGGLDAWPGADLAHPSRALDPGLEVQVLDDQGDRTHVLCSNGWSAWVDGRRLEPIAVPEPTATVAGDTDRAWLPTHRVPGGGLDAWSEPDPEHPTQALDPDLEVQVLGDQGDWTQVLCSNGWSAWVDGRRLEPLTVDDPRMLVPPTLATALEDGLRACLDAIDDYEAGRIDAAGLQLRMVRDGVVRYQDTLWVLDLDGGTWWRYDGLELRRMVGTGGRREG